MSKIIVFAEGLPPEERLSLVACLRRITNLGIKDIRELLHEGRPVAEYVPFMNDHAEVSGRLRRLLAEVPATGARLRLYELPPDEAFGTCDCSEQNRITSEQLLNILDNHDARRLGF